MNKKLILMVSAPGAGKSYKAKQLAASVEPPARSIILSTDDRITVGDTYLWSPDYINLSHKLNQAMCKKAIQLMYELVIIDNTNIVAEHRKPYIEMGEQYGYEVELVEPDTPWKYDAEECFKRCSHNVPLQTIERMIQKLQSSLKNDPLYNK